MGGCRPEAEYDEENICGGGDGEKEADEIRRKYDRNSLDITWSSSMEEGVREHDSTSLVLGGGCFCVSVLLSLALLYFRPVVADSSESDNISSTTSSSGAGEGRVCAMSCRVDFADDDDGSIPRCELY